MFVFISLRRLVDCTHLTAAGRHTLHNCRTLSPQIQICWICGPIFHTVSFPQGACGPSGRRLWRSRAVSEMLWSEFVIGCSSHCYETMHLCYRSTLKPGVPPPLPPKVRPRGESVLFFFVWLSLNITYYIFALLPLSQPRLNSSSEELGLNDERSLTVRRFPNSENGPSQVTRRQSTPEQGNKVEHSSPDYLSASVSSPGCLSHTSDHGKTWICRGPWCLSLLFPFSTTEH